MTQEGSKQDWGKGKTGVNTQGRGFLRRRIKCVQSKGQGTLADCEEREKCAHP